MKPNLSNKERQKVRAWLWGRAMEVAVARHIRAGRSSFKNPYILAQNYRSRGGELDIVLEADGIGGRRRLVVIEVRARALSARDGGMADPVETIGPKKQQRIRKALQVFLMTYKGNAQEIVTMLASVNLGPEGGRVDFREF